jgi:ABC-type multidrug transport system ATPase subunit
LFGRFAALRELSADFQAGRLYAIFGENGAGKSTLLRIIAGLSKPTRGRAAFDSGAEAATAQNVGYMAHASMLYDELSGMENLRYFGGLRGVTRTAHLQDLLRKVGLNPKLSRRVGDYSQGMRQRLSLARAVVHDPAVVLLDEPFSNLDAASAQDLARLLGEMRSAGKCVLVVTHQPRLLEDVADESLLLAQGRIAARGLGINAAAVQPQARETSW